MKKWYRYLGIAFIAAVCIFGVACGEDGDGDNFTIEDLKEIASNLPEAQTSFDMTAAEFVAGMRIGWNLGNTLDADGGETSWVSHRTNQSNITAIKEVGFNVIRIPVTWYKTAAMNTDTYEITEDWMNRVKRIVDFAVNENMYIILNTHHDEGIFKFTEAEKENSLNAFKKIWEQIADAFKDYDEKLIFEGLNEPRTKGSSQEWNGGTESEREILNEYYQVFVDTVRASGGNNDKRFLSINTYGGNSGSNAVNGLSLPTDSAQNKLIVQIHAYVPYNFALNTDSAHNTWSGSVSSDTNQIRNAFSAANTKFVTQGVPVIMGEFGAMNKNNDDARKAWAEYYVGYAKSLGIPCIVWDNGAFSGSGERFALINRSDNTFPNPKYLEGLMRGAGIIK